jgi:hypothetical protein
VKTRSLSGCSHLATAIRGKVLFRLRSARINVLKEMQVLAGTLSVPLSKYVRYMLDFFKFIDREDN